MESIDLNRNKKREWNDNKKKKKIKKRKMVALSRSFRCLAPDTEFLQKGRTLIFQQQQLRWKLQKRGKQFLLSNRFLSSGDFSFVSARLDVFLPPPGGKTDLSEVRHVRQRLTSIIQTSSPIGRQRERERERERENVNLCRWDEPP